MGEFAFLAFSQRKFRTRGVIDFQETIFLVSSFGQRTGGSLA
jgi:hypothetical protein